MLQQLGIDLNTIGPHMLVRQSKRKPKRAWQNVQSCDRRASLLTALDDVFNSNSSNNSSSNVPIVSSTAATTAAVTANDSNQYSDVVMYDRDVCIDEQVAYYSGVLCDGVADAVAETVSRRRSLSTVGAAQQCDHAEVCDTDTVDVTVLVAADVVLYNDAVPCETVVTQDVTAAAPVECVISDGQLQLQKQLLQSSNRSQKQHAQAKQLLSAATKRLMLVQHAPWWGWVPAVTNSNANSKSNGHVNGQTGHIMATKPAYRLATVPTLVTADSSSSCGIDSALNSCELLWSPGREPVLSGPKTDSDCDQLMRINSSSSSSDIAAIVQRIAQFAASNSSVQQQSTSRTSSAKQVQPLALAVLKVYSRADTVQDTAQQQYTAKAIALATASEITTALHDLLAGLYGQQACLQACVHAPTETNTSSSTTHNDQQLSQQQQSQQQQQQHPAFYRVLWRRGKRAIVAHVQCKYPAVLNVGSHLCAVTGDSAAFTLTEVQDSELEKLAIYKTDQLVKTLQRSFSGKAKRDSYSSGGYNYSGSSSEGPSTAYSNRTDEPRSASNSIQQLYCDWCFVGNSTTTAITSTNGDNTVTAATTITTVGTSSSSSSNDTLLLWEVHGLQTVEQYKLDCASRKLNYETKLNLNLKLANRPHLSETNTATAVVNSALTLAHPSVTEQAVQELIQQQQQCR
jgi:hypothetical protein